MQHFLTDIIEFTDGVEIDAVGILRGKAKIGRIGVQEYWIDGKKVGVFRPEDEVIKSKDGFANQVVTLNHPPDGVMVNSDNFKEYSVGLTGRVTYENGWLESMITVGDKEAVAAARTTHKQFSNGYWAELDESPGSWLDKKGIQGKPGISYDYKYIQKDIVGNHISLVMAARAGGEATFTDNEIKPEKCFTIIKDEQVNLNFINKKKVTMQITDNRGATFTLDDAHADQIVSYINYLKDMAEKAEEEAEDMKHKAEDAAKLAKDMEKKAEEAEEDGEKYKKDLAIATDALTKFTGKDNLTEAVTELESNGMMPEMACTTIKYCTELWSTYLNDGGDPAKVDYSLDADGIKDLILADQIPNYQEMVKDASPERKAFIWEYKDNFGAKPKTQQPKDNFNDDLLKRINRGNNQQALNDSKQALKDAEQEFVKNATAVQPGNM